MSQAVDKFSKNITDKALFNTNNCCIGFGDKLQY